MRTKPRLARAIGALLAAGWLARCAPEAPAETIVLVTLDTTRADRIGCYGYASASTPSLDRLASEGARFDQALAPVPVTLPSHASMFTGQYPAVHGVRYNGMFNLPESAVTVAERLKESGYATGAVPAAFPVARRTGLAQGFDDYLDLFAEPGAKDLRPGAERKAADVTRLGLEWLASHEGKRRFLWLHYYDPHSAYEPPFPYSAEYRDRPYDGEIAYMDREVGKVLDALRSGTGWGTTLVIVAGDHGEGLYDHGERLHSSLVYESTLRVPLIVRVPGQRRPRVVADPVSLVDVTPTILDYAGLPVPPGLDGVSLRAGVHGAEAPRRDLHFESLAGSLLYGWSPLEGIRRGNWKYTRSASPELFDLSRDSGEKSNLFDVEKSRAADMESALASDLARFGAAGSAAEAVAKQVDDETAARLASLGYVGGTIVAERRGGPHPRDLIFLETSINHARELQDQKDWAGAVAGWVTVLEADPKNRFALIQGSVAARQLKDDARERAWLESLFAAYPDFELGALQLGDYWAARRAFARAAEVFEKGLEASPGDSRLEFRFVLASLAAGRPEAAVPVIERAISEGHDPAMFLVLRAQAHAAAGRGPQAIASLREAVGAGFDERSTLEEEPMLEALRRVPGAMDVIRTVPPPAPSPSPSPPPVADGGSKTQPVLGGDGPQLDRAAAK